ncbi:MAG: hypothetical protein AAGJ87_04855 [Pseudomonadota bacterium]
MTVFEQVSLDMAISAEKWGVRLQRGLGALGVMAAIVWGIAGNGIGAAIFGGWSLGVLLLPSVFGRMVAAGIYVMCALAVFMGDNGGGTTFRADAALLSLPFCFIAGVLWSRSFAGYLAAATHQAFRLMLTKS